MQPKKVFVITGASTGIGAETARLAAGAGYSLVLASRSIDKLQALAEELSLQTKAIAVQCDVSQWLDQKELLAKTLEVFGRVDVVFANAGFSQGSLILGGEDSPEEWKDMVLTNVYGVAVTARIFLPELIKSKGHLLLTSSVVGRVTAPGNLYSATKWAVTGMGEAIRQQTVGMDVHVTLIEPGRVDTPFWKQKPTEPMLQSQDVARAVMFAITQPEHVNVSEILVRPTNQKN